MVGCGIGQSVAPLADTRTADDGLVPSSVGWLLLDGAVVSCTVSPGCGVGLLTVAGAVAVGGAGAVVVVVVGGAVVGGVVTGGVVATGGVVTGGATATTVTSRPASLS